LAKKTAKKTSKAKPAAKHGKAVKTAPKTAKKAAPKAAKKAAPKTKMAAKPAKKAAPKAAAKAKKAAPAKAVKHAAPAKKAPAPVQPAKAAKAAESAGAPGVAKVEYSKGSEPILLHHRPPTKPEVAAFRKTLVDLRRQLTDDVEQMESEAFSNEGREISANHLAESSSAQYEQDFTLNIIETETTELSMIQRAIEKIDGVIEMPFGKCESCGIWISIERLKAKPFSRICIHCATKFETQGGGEEFGVIHEDRRY
jgi:RNA polymerase-binding transcription factor DksA